MRAGLVGSAAVTPACLPDLRRQLCARRPAPREHPGARHGPGQPWWQGADGRGGPVRHAGGGGAAAPAAALPRAAGCGDRGGAAERRHAELPRRFHRCGPGPGEAGKGREPRSLVGEAQCSWFPLTVLLRKGEEACQLGSYARHRDEMLS